MWISLPSVYLHCHTSVDVVVWCYPALWSSTGFAVTFTELENCMEGSLGWRIFKISWLSLDVFRRYGHERILDTPEFSHLSPAPM